MTSPQTTPAKYICGCGKIYLFPVDHCPICKTKPKAATPQTAPTKDELAAAIHDAKIRACWGSTKWDERRAIEPWTKSNPAVPNQPWHDVAIAQAEVVMKLMGLP